MLENHPFPYSSGAESGLPVSESAKTSLYLYRSNFSIFVSLRRRRKKKKERKETIRKIQDTIFRRSLRGRIGLIRKGKKKNRTSSSYFWFPRKKKFSLENSIGRSKFGTRFPRSSLTSPLLFLLVEFPLERLSDWFKIGSVRAYLMERKCCGALRFHGGETERERESTGLPRLL